MTSLLTRVAIIAILATVVTAGDVCPDTELPRLLALADLAEISQCRDDSGFLFVPPTGAPSDDQVAIMCSSDACQVTIRALIALEPADCELSLPSGGQLNVYQLLENHRTACSGERLATEF